MNKQQENEFYGYMRDIFMGILAQSKEFSEGTKGSISYDFNCAEYATLRKKYKLVELAGKGSDFERAVNLMKYFAPRLTHSSWYDNHVPCNALDLLAYSFNNPEQGINCLNKSKILEELCLAIGIYARRVSIMPYSPYDFDNHVVTEIFDRKSNKWIMLDPTTNGYFIDDKYKPLSLLEMRARFASGEYCSFKSATDRTKNLDRLKSKNVYNNMYICKNLFYFIVDADSTFGETGKHYIFLPKGFSMKQSKISNAEYRIKNMSADRADFKKYWRDRLAKMKSHSEYTSTDISVMTASPIE